MEITKNQIVEIESYLNSKGITYIDIQYEILDHIITDISEIMQVQNLSFGEAWKIVQQKWKPSFEKKSSWWLGLATYKPAVLIDKSVRIYKPLYRKYILLMMSLSAVTTIILYNFTTTISSFKNLIENGISIGILLYTVQMLFWAISIKKTKVKSSYSFLFYRQILPYQLFAILFNPFVSNLYFNSKNEFSFGSLVILYSFILSAIGGRYLYKKHIETITNYKISLN